MDAEPVLNADIVIDSNASGGIEVREAGACFDISIHSFEKAPFAVKFRVSKTMSLAAVRNMFRQLNERRDEILGCLEVAHENRTTEIGIAIVEEEKRKQKPTPMRSALTCLRPSL